MTDLDALKKIPGYVDAVVAHYPGEVISESMRGLLARISLRVFGTAADKEELWKRLMEVQDAVHITSTEGEDMVLPGYEYSDIDGYLRDI